jgi:putative copper export protein
MRRMQVLLFLHVVAMAFFLGGQLMLASTVVPVERSNPDPARMRAIAQRFGLGSLAALAVLLFTGMLMASHYDLWSYGDFQIKMGLVVALVISVFAHMQFPKAHALMGLTFLLTLGIVWIGLDLPV